MRVIDFAKTQLEESKRSERWKEAYYWVSFLDGARKQSEEEISEEEIQARLLSASDDEIKELIISARTAAEALEAYLTEKPGNNNAPYTHCKPVKLVVREEYGGLYPYCPTCKNMSYGTIGCAICGQPFIRDDRFEIRDWCDEE